MAEPIEFQILGPIGVTRGGNAVDLGGPKQRAVLAMLVINANRPITSDQLIDTVWADRPPPSALATLQAYISNLRRAIEPGPPVKGRHQLLQKNGGGYQLSVDPEAVDAQRFERLLDDAGQMIGASPSKAAERISAALSLWRGPPLADFRYADFAQVEIARLEELRASAMELRIEAELASGRHGDLVHEIEQLLEAHPYRERLWGHLMVALYRADRQTEALRAFRRCEELLDEVGLSPGESLRKLEMAILDHEPSLSPPVPAPDAPSGGPGTLVGREAERRVARAQLKEAARGRGSIVVVEGEAGIGKTRFLESVQRSAQDLGFSTALARCVEVGGTPPFWPWIQLTKRLGSDRLLEAAGPHAATLAPLVPHDRPAAPVVAPLFHVASALASALQRLAADQPILLLIDDLYSADPDSLTVLALLAAEIDDSRVVIVTSHRGHDLGPDHPLTETLGALSRLDSVVRLPLPRLSLPEVGELVGSLTDEAPTLSTVEAIYARSEGNAFFTVELTKLLLAEGDLTRTGLASAMPPTVVEVLGRRISRLEPDTLRLVRCGAVFGREFELLVVAEALSMDHDAALTAIDEALGNGLIVETDRPGVYRFSHMIVVDTVTHSLGALRRAQLHGQIANALADRARVDPSRLVDLAHHRSGAVPLDGPLPAIEALARAGHHALDANAVELAEGLFTARLDLVEGLAPTLRRNDHEIAALFDLGKVWTWREGYHSAKLDAAADRLWELTGISRDEIDLPSGAVIDHRHPILASFQARFSVEIVSGRIAAAEAVTERLLALAADHDHPMVRYAAHQTALTCFSHAGRLQEAKRSADEALRALDELEPDHDGSVMLPLGQQPARVTYHAFAAWLAWLLGEPAWRDELRAARRACARNPFPYHAGFVATVEGIVWAMNQSPTEVLETQAWARSVADGEVFGPVRSWLAIQAAWAHGMLDGDPGEAAATMVTQLGELSADGTEVAHTLYWGLVAQLALRAGDDHMALQASRRGLDRVRTAGERFWHAELERLEAEAVKRLGRSLHPPTLVGSGGPIDL